MPAIQPSNSTSIKITNRPTQGDTLGSASNPPRCGSTTGPNFQAAQMASTQNVSDTASRTNPRRSPIKMEPNTTNRIKTSAPVIGHSLPDRNRPCRETTPTNSTSWRNQGRRMTLFHEFESEPLGGDAIGERTDANPI